MLRYFIMSLVVTAAYLPAVADELPRQWFATTASLGNRIPTSAHVSTEANNSAALNLYRRGLEDARRGDPRLAFSAFDKALELDPGLARAY